MSELDPRHPEPAELMTADREGGILRVVLHSVAIGHREAPVLRSSIIEQIREAEPLRTVILDMSRLTLVNTVGVAMLSDVRNAAYEGGATTMLLGLSRELTQQLDAAGVKQLFVFDE